MTPTLESRVAKALEEGPKGWLVAGGRTFVDQCHTHKLHAESSQEARRDGSQVLPLHSDHTALIRDLADEVERLKERCEKFKQQCHDTHARAVKAESQRDALLSAAVAVTAHLGPGGYIPNAGKPATDALLAAIDAARTGDSHER